MSANLPNMFFGERNKSCPVRVYQAKRAAQLVVKSYPQLQSLRFLRFVYLEGYFAQAFFDLECGSSVARKVGELNQFAAGWVY